MIGQIGNQVFVWKAVAGILGIVIPIIALVIWKKKKMSIKPAVVGAVTFFVFSQILEAIPKTLLFTLDSSVSRYMWTHAWAYVLTGGLLAGVFEEVGRYVAFRFFLKNKQDKKDAVTYGIGHGGIETMLTLGLGAVSSMSLALMINNGTLQQSISGMGVGQMKSLELQVSALAGYGVARMLLEVFERIVAMALHISLSVVVFKAVQDKKAGCLFAAILLHAVFDVPAAMYQCGVIGIGLAEVILFVSALVSVGIAGKVYGTLK